MRVPIPVILYFSSSHNALPSKISITILNNMYAVAWPPRRLAAMFARYLYTHYITCYNNTFCVNVRYEIIRKIGKIFRCLNSEVTSCVNLHRVSLRRTRRTNSHFVEHEKKPQGRRVTTSSCSGEIAELSESSLCIPPYPSPQKVIAQLDPSIMRIVRLLPTYHYAS